VTRPIARWTNPVARAAEEHVGTVVASTLPLRVVTGIVHRLMSTEPRSQPSEGHNPPSGSPAPAKDHAGTERLVVELEKYSSRRRCAGFTFLLVIGVVGVVGFFTQGPADVAYLVIGLLLVLIGLGAFPTGLKVFGRRSKLILSAEGLQQRNPGGGSWFVPWEDIGATALTRHAVLSLTSVTSRPAGSESARTGRKVAVGLEFLPRQTGFRERYPEVVRGHWVDREVGGFYRVKVDSLTDRFHGATRKVVDPLDGTLRELPSSVYQGMLARGALWQRA
jgi:hypothetical protein